MKLGAVVVADQPCRLLEMLWLEFDDRGSAEAQCLLAACDERLAKLAADGFAAEQPQMAAPCAETEQLFRPWRTQPLKIDRQVFAVEILADRGSEELRRRQIRRRHFQMRNALPVR